MIEEQTVATADRPWFFFNGEGFEFFATEKEAHEQADVEMEMLLESGLSEEEIESFSVGFVSMRPKKTSNGEYEYLPVKPLESTEEEQDNLVLNALREAVETNSYISNLLSKSNTLEQATKRCGTNMWIICHSVKIENKKISESLERLFEKGLTSRTGGNGQSVLWLAVDSFKKLGNKKVTR